MKRRAFLFLAIAYPFAGATFAAPSTDDETGIAEWIRGGAEDFLKDIGTQVRSWRDEAQKYRQLQSRLVAGPDQEALVEMQQLVRRGHPGAINFIGWLLDNGHGGVPRDSSKAAVYFKRAGDMGELSGQYNLGLLKLLGRGAKKMHKEAIDIFVLLDRKGHELASFQLGREAEKNGKHAEAARFYAKASLGRRHPYAIFKTGFSSFMSAGAGIGTRDRKGGLMMMERAAGLWSPEAMAALVEIYAKGIYVPVSAMEAAKWFVLLQQNPHLSEADRAQLPQLRGMFTIDNANRNLVERNAAIWRHHHPIDAAGPRMDYDRTIY